MGDLLGLGRSILRKQPFSAYLGTELVLLKPGRAVLTLAARPEFLQQNGFVHGGVMSYLVDNALAFAGGSVLGENVATAEFKLNFIRPVCGRRLIATATVEGSGSRLAVCRCEVTSIADEKESLCALGQGTIMKIDPAALDLAGDS